MICFLRKKPHSQQPSAAGWSQLVASTCKPASTRLAALSPLYEEQRQSKKRHVSNMMQAYTIVGRQRWLLAWRDALQQEDSFMHYGMQVLVKGTTAAGGGAHRTSQTYGL